MNVKVSINSLHCDIVLGNSIGFSSISSIVQGNNFTIVYKEIAEVATKNKIFLKHTLPLIIVNKYSNIFFEMQAMYKNFQYTIPSMVVNYTKATSFLLCTLILSSLIEKV